MDVTDFFDIERELHANEVKFLKREIPKSKFRLFYAVWNQKRKNNAYLCVIIDCNNGTRRRAALFNSIKIIVERSLCEAEYHEEIQNFGGFSRRFKVFNFKSLDEVTEFDAFFDLEVPAEYRDYVKIQNLETETQLSLGL